MTDKIEFIEEDYGVKAIIRAPWEEHFIHVLLEKKIKGLELNHGKGWFGENIEFLHELENLRVLKIFDFRVNSISPIHSLNKLSEIHISTYCKTPIDFKCFPELLRCGIEWRKGSETLFECTQLRKLFINKYNQKSSNLFSKLTKLEELSILNSKIEDLNFLHDFKFLRKLRIANLRQVNSLKGIENVNSLKELNIQSCKNIKSISEVFFLNELRRLLLVDNSIIATLKGIENLDKLEGLFFYGTTNILDGDLSPLLKLKKLNNISFMNRRHYSHKKEDFGEKHHSGIHNEV